MTTCPRHYRRNEFAFAGDIIAFSLAVTFASMTTVLPDFVARLTPSQVSIGLLSTVSQGVWLVPQLVFANMLTNKRYKKPYVLLGGIIGRPLYLLYAIALWLGLAQHPTLALLLLFGVQFVFYGSDALAAVAWLDMLGKTIPEKRRGRLIGHAQLLSGMLAIGAGSIIAALLSADGPAFPYNYAWILVIADALLMLSWVACSLIVEPDEPVQTQRTPWRDYARDLIHTLRQDRAFARLVVVRLLAGFDGLALGFYILFATRELGLPPASVGLFTTVQMLGRILASLGLGRLSERAGSYRVIQVTTAITMTAPLAGLALLLTDLPSNTAIAVGCGWIFVTIGVTSSAIMLGFFNAVLELAPAEQRPTYIGLFNTLSGLLLVLPAFGGWILRYTSYGVLFTLSAVVLVIAHGLSWRLSPAHAEAAQREESAPQTSA